MADEAAHKVQVNPQLLKERFYMLVDFFYNVFIEKIEEENRLKISLNKEILHCAVKAYFDDIIRYKNYAGSEYADKHKQAAYTIKWINKFKPIQIKENAEMNTVLLTINQSFALAAGFLFLDISVAENVSQKFLKHLMYVLTYRNITGKNLATLMYVMECATKGKKIL